MTTPAAGGGGPLFKELAVEDEQETTEMESLCMACEKTGTTRLLLTKIPMFREVVVMSFSCPHCHTSNSEIQSGAPIQDRGVRYTISVSDKTLLSRMVVKSDTATVQVPELEFEVPPHTQKGCVTCVEGILSQAVSGLRQEQPLRRALDADLADKIDDFIGKLEDCVEGKTAFTLVLDDPAGNSFVDSSSLDSSILKLERYNRTVDQDRQLGILSPVSEGEASSVDGGVQDATSPSVGAAQLAQGEREGGGEGDPGGEGSTTVASHSDTQAQPGGDGGGGDGGGGGGAKVDMSEVLSFPTNCYNCQSATETRMKLVDIPNFKQVIIMATTCDFCGFRSNEVKSGTGVSPQACRITLRLTGVSDLSRDVLKSDTAALLVPELDFAMESGTLGGRFTTVEGVLDLAWNQLRKSNPFAVGDSTQDTKMKDFLRRLKEVVEGRRLGVHVVLDDPAGNSYIQNVHAPEADPEMKVEHYRRSAEQNDVLGLTDMKTENYF